MAHETEIKLRIGDVRAFHRALKRMGARPAGKGPERVHELNVIFDTPDGGLAKHGQLLRIRTESPQAQGRAKAKNSKQRVVLTFKQPIPGAAAGSTRHLGRGYKVRDETELEVSDAGSLTQIFEGLGMSDWFRYEKYRSTFQLPKSKPWAQGLLIELDETPIGTFVELEGPVESMYRAATELGFSRNDYVLKNYLVLYMEECRRKGEQPSHMLFPPQKSHSK